MGLLEQEIKELRVLNKRIDEGTIDKDYLNSKIEVYSQTEKRAKLILQAMALNAKYGGNTAIKKLKTSNLVGGEIALDDSPSVQIIACPDIGKAITREECLDYSGDVKNVEPCGSCREFNITRSMLIAQK